MKCIVADIGGTNIRAAQYVHGELLNYIHPKQTQKDRPGERIAETLKEAIDEASQGTRPNILGIAVPGTIHLEKGVIGKCGIVTSLNGFSLTDWLHDKYGDIPVVLMNDGKAFTVAEHYATSPRPPSTFGVVIGTGRGRGFIENDNLLTGKNCAAGEDGGDVHPLYRKKRKHNTIDDVCSGRWFEREYKTSGKDLYELAKISHPAALEAYQRFGQNLAYGIEAGLVATPPHQVVIGGVIKEAFPYVEPAFRTTLAQLLEKKRIDMPDVIRAAALEHPNLLGMGRLCDQYIEQRLGNAVGALTTHV